MGEIGLLCDVDRSATIVAITAVVVLRLERQIFLDLLDQDGRLASAVLKGGGRAPSLGGGAGADLSSGEGDPR
jgi:hypothetical protein